MIEQVLPDIFKIEIPLPKKPFKGYQFTLFEVMNEIYWWIRGLICEESRQAMVSALQELNVRMENTDLFITPLCT